MKAILLSNESDNAVVLISTIRVARMVCEDPKCTRTHGFGVTFVFLCWEVGLGVAFA